ncbi:sodium/potassium/calcium exchanger 6, mitochondrial-like isoform X2 [Mizuhopecten yessoensis]|uniref:sodium/potassium/calcium exchanger 6, mitochondrial-like isoform X2 n=1 Tax=Mizuhopecten yessoensis TaxID=6573 RepID=UPI000B45895D|nr:sodium/potassium/calcium exchanger 6, mitochondrial-like isoform X2 [Mizuhopecten yessoensis]
MDSRPHKHDTDRGGRKFIGLLLLAGVFLVYYFYKETFSTPQVIKYVPRRSPAVVLRKLHWLKDGELVSGTLTTGRDLVQVHEILNATQQLGDDDDVECREVLNEDKDKRCDFVKQTDDCQIDEGFLDYTQFVYCDFGSGGHLQILGMIILFLWWVFLFTGLAVTADDFFCPALSVISETMHLSHNVAGVTFLAFGNGAPDIFSAIAAIGNAKNGDAGLAIGALFGAGVFVTTVVAGSIAVICPFQAMQRPFLRDVIFYLAAAFWSFSILWKKEITKIESIGFILMYACYVLVVVFGRYIYKKYKKSIPSSERDPLLEDRINRSVSQDDLTEMGETRGVFQEFLSAINPIDMDKWPQMKIYSKVYEVFKAPLMFLLIITVPVVDKEEDKHKWNQLLNSLQCFTGLLFSSLATKVGFETIGGTFPLWVLSLIIGAGLSILVLLTTKNDVQPKYHAVFAYLGFLVACIWIYSIANEIVNILQTFGIVLNISNAILGLTLLAWGNSIGDLIADTVMARQGYPRMGISACFGGPLFNLLLGIGIPFTVATIKNGGTYKLQITFEEVVLAAFLMLSLVVSLTIVPLSKFKMSRMYGIILIVLYVIFLIVAILAETNVIDVKI